MPNLPPIPPANSSRDFSFIGKVSYLLTWQNGIGEAGFLGLKWHALYWLEDYHVYLRRKGGRGFGC